MSKLEIISISFSLLAVNHMINDEIDEDFVRWVLKLWVLLIFVALILVTK